MAVGGVEKSAFPTLFSGMNTTIFYETDMNDSVFDKLINEIKEKKNRYDEKSLNDDILICDGMNTFLRGFHVNPASNEDGVHIGGIVGFLNSLGYAIKRFNPTRCIVVFDGEGGSYRRKQIYSEYKAGRSKTTTSNRFYQFHNDPEAIVEDKNREISRVAEYLQCLPVTFVMINKIEADDVIAYIATDIYNGPDHNIKIMSTDKDFLQLVNENVHVWRPTEKKLYTPDVVKEKYEIPANQFMLLRTIEGDSSDNIPGVPYVGKKRVKKSLKELINKDKRQSVDEIIQYASKRTDESTTYQRIVDNQDVIERNWRLMQLHEVDISLSKMNEVRSAVEDVDCSLDRICFERMYREDKLWKVIQNAQTWLSERFSKLSRFSNKNNS